MRETLPLKKSTRLQEGLSLKERSPLLDLQQEFVLSIGRDGKRIGLGRKIIDKLKSPKVLLPLVAGATIAAAFLPGFIEGYLAVGTLKGALLYSLASTPLSAIGEKVTNIAFVIGQAVKGVVAPLLEVVSKYMLALRSTIIPAITSAGLVGGFLSVYERTKRMNEAIKQGIAPIQRNTPQMFALFGEDTYVGDAFYKINKQHVIPVVENPLAMRRVLTGNEELGSFITVPNQEYGSDGLRGPWRLLKFNKNWLVPSRQGKLLIVYGFGETKDEELPLRDEPIVDLTVEELAIATRNLKKQAEKMLVKPDKVVTIYLGNSGRMRLRGTASGLQALADKDVAKGTVDIYIDIGKTLAASLKDALGNTGSMSFETGVPEYWNGMKELAQKYNITLHDEKNPDTGQATILVYEQNTDESVQSAIALKQKLPNRRIVVLTSSLETQEQAKKLGVESFCVAEVLAKELYHIQQRLIQGETPQSIQQSLL